MLVSNCKGLVYGVYGPVQVSYFIFSKFCSLNTSLNIIECLGISVRNVFSYK